jgi:Uncharacterized protein conserved in bacteria (DUF2332)
VQVAAVLYPAVAHAARHADAIGLIGAEGLDRVAIEYTDGRTLGDPSAPVRVSARVVGERPVPGRPLPEVVARVPSGPDLAGAVRRVPAGALPVVTTTWALSRIARKRRRELLTQLADAGRPVAWVSVEGVGTAPWIPTLGDRHASGHSIIAVARFDEGFSARAVGRCWSRGTILSWLA